MGHSTEAVRRYRAKNKEKIAKQKLECKSSIEGRSSYLIAIKRAYCKNNKLEFNLTKEFLVDLYKTQKGECAVTRLPLCLKLGGGRKPENISLDRIDPSKGYIMDNVRFVCWQVNAMKFELSDFELKQWCLKIIEGLE